MGLLFAMQDGPECQTCVKHPFVILNVSMDLAPDQTIVLAKLDGKIDIAFPC